MYAEKHTVDATLDAGGNGTFYTDVVTGRLLTVQYVKNNFADTVDIAITTETTGMSLLTLGNQTTSGVYHPRSPVHGPTGSGLTLNGNQTVNEPVTIVAERVKIAITQGGNGTLGTFVIIVG